jgi:hypothetical protein
MKMVDAWEVEKMLEMNAKLDSLMKGMEYVLAVVSQSKEAQDLKKAAEEEQNKKR